MLWLSNKELALRELVARRFNILASFIEGDHIARGFADVGYEQFVVLNEGKVLSLFTGKISAVDIQERPFFFPILSVDQLANMVIDKTKISIMFLHNLWQVEFDNKSDSQRTVKKGKVLASIFLELLGDV